MASYLEYTKKLAVDRRAARLAGLRSPRWLRIILTATAVLAFALLALLDERPRLMLFGLAPLALIAGEAIWHLFRPR